MPCDMADGQAKNGLIAEIILIYYIPIYSSYVQHTYRHGVNEDSYHDNNQHYNNAHYYVPFIMPPHYMVERF